jgi:hypothetical protein
MNEFKPIHVYKHLKHGYATTLYTQCTHLQLFVLYCTTTWRQTGLSRKIVEGPKGEKDKQTDEKYTVVILELIPQITIVLHNFSFSFRDVIFSIFVVLLTMTMYTTI